MSKPEALLDLEVAQRDAACPMPLFSLRPQPIAAIAEVQERNVKFRKGRKKGCSEDTVRVCLGMEFLLIGLDWWLDWVSKFYFEGHFQDSKQRPAKAWQEAKWGDTW